MRGAALRSGWGSSASRCFDTGSRTSNSCSRTIRVSSRSSDVEEDVSMKASYRWLRELVPGLDASPKDLAARLTGAGLEVEGMIEFGAGAEACIVACVTG